YPNPFNPTTTIKYQIPNQVRDDNSSVIARSDATWQSNVEMRYIQSVRLIVYDILGREVATLVNQKQKPGNYEVEFNARNLKSGIYFYRISAGSYTEVKKMILLK
ncbi:MAG: T9SS type A sorting domain-containing protein, partial [Ignavibacteriae bacterium]|nr:T9SS type A sorting domain-containing protein [Ignavibacteriota bacterium]